MVALCEEEGSRFTDPMWGTQAMLGMIADGTPDALVDEDGVTIAEAMASVGLDARELPSARRDDIACFVELHIEQGGVLEAEGIPMGIVTAITGQRQLSVEVTGKQNHAGTTPMDMRADALVGAALLIAEVESAARELGRPAVATVGMIQASPGSRNVVPGAVSFTVDLRSTDEEQMAEMTRAIEAAAVAIGETRRLDCKVTEVSYHHPVAMSESVRAVIAQVATAAEVTASPMPSGAGHDSQLFAERVPTAMIFTPSVDGISHSPLEFTPIEQIQPCVEVLAGVLWALAERED